MKTTYRQIFFEGNTLNLDFDGIKFEENQKLIDLAVEKKVFSLIDSLIVKNDRFHYEVYFIFYYCGLIMRLYSCFCKEIFCRKNS